MEKIYFSHKPNNDSRSFFNYLPSDTADLDRIREKEETLKNVSKTEKELYKGLVNHHPRFKELARYIEYVISTYDTDYCDLGIKSFGVVIRDGKPCICILDTGRSGKI